MSFVEDAKEDNIQPSIEPFGIFQDPHLQRDL